MQLKTIKPEEYQQYCTILSKHGFSKNDFVLAEEPVNNKALPDDTQPKGGITVLNRHNNRHKTYPSATGNSWTLQFEQDLMVGFFNK